MLPPAPHSRLNCKALYYSHIIHASLIKAVSSPIVKLENVQHLLSGNLMPGIGSWECQVCRGGLPKVALIGFSIAVPDYLCLILGAEMMPKGLWCQKGEAETSS